MRYQAVRDGQFVGVPQKTREAAEVVIAEDKEYTAACYDQGWITTFRPYGNGETYVKHACRWWIRKVR